jgi:hypothetical protein
MASFSDKAAAVDPRAETNTGDRAAAYSIAPRDRGRQSANLERAAHRAAWRNCNTPDGFGAIAPVFVANQIFAGLSSIYTLLVSNDP